MTTSHLPMETELSRFCQDYAKILFPLREELGKSIDFIRDQQDTDDIRNTLSRLCDAHHRLKTLAEKIDSQQAYVIIFGPLKSGKSTLMNAFSGAYVSEVTALPAYPCLVHVRHEEQVSLTASRFNGQIERFDDYQQMQSAIDAYHRELAEQIREIEEQGETFEPGIHCPTAIRRLDIGLPAEPLQESYTILVDTPGLYSRMKFGYDLMSREFRDSAACAVFVVKTDNLFLEQVFDEFNDLLSLFSRIFLVVNIDGHKCDLEPDGELRPSLESRDPQRIVDAFCSLSMSAPLRNAYEQGRLKIYPIDLLKAASERLGEDNAAGNDDSSAAGDSSGEKTSNDGADEENENASSEENAPNSAESMASEAKATQSSHIGSSKFDEFMADLTRYLNSNDYLIHFMLDSMRQGRQLIQEVQDGCREENLQAFIVGLKSLQSDYERKTEHRQALSRLHDLDWGQTFSGVQNQLKEASDNFIRTEQVRLEKELTKEVGDWFANTESLKQLLEERVNPVFDQLPELFRKFMLEQMGEATNSSLGGAELPEERRRDLEKVELSLFEIRRKALDAALHFGETTSVPGKRVAGEAILVQRRFWDWLLFRSMNRIREKIFGPQDNPEKSISVKLKQTRLGEKSKSAFIASSKDQLQEAFAELSETLSKGMVKTYVESATEAVVDVLNRRIKELDQQLPHLRSSIQTRKQIRKALDTLARQTGNHAQELTKLENTFAHLHPRTEEESAEEADDDTSEEPVESLNQDEDTAENPHEETVEIDSDISEEVSSATEER